MVVNENATKQEYHWLKEENNRAARATCIFSGTLHEDNMKSPNLRFYWERTKCKPLILQSVYFYSETALTNLFTSPALNDVNAME